MGYPYGGFPHPFNDPQRQPPGAYEAHPVQPGVHDPRDYERFGDQGRAEYHRLVQQEAAFQREQAARGRESGGSAPRSEASTGVNPEHKTRGPYRVNVDYRISPAAMIQRGGYDVDGVSSRGGARRLVTGQWVWAHPETEQVDITLIRFPQGIFVGNIDAVLKQIGVRPANGPQLLAFGATYPNFQGCKMVCAVDGIVDGNTFDYVYLATEEGSNKRFFSYWTPLNYNTYWHFTATHWIAVVQDRKQTPRVTSPSVASAAAAGSARVAQTLADARRAATSGQAKPRPSQAPGGAK